MCSRFSWTSGCKRATKKSRGKSSSECNAISKSIHPRTPHTAPQDVWHMFDTLVNSAHQCEQRDILFSSVCVSPAVAQQCRQCSVFKVKQQALMKEPIWMKGLPAAFQSDNVRMRAVL